jgi:tetratricopeptide (TPR) repeat protein
MSLVNQMLKDLSNRSKPPMGDEIMLAGMLTNLRYRSKKNILDFWIYGMIFILLLFIVAMGIPRYLEKRHSGLKAILSPNVVTKASLTIPPKITQDISSRATVFLTGMSLEVKKNMTSLRFLLNEDLLYRIDKVSPDHLRMVFEDTHLVANLPPLNTINTAIRTIEMHYATNGDLIIDLNLVENTELTSLDLQHVKGMPELQLDLLDKNIDNATLIEKSNSIKKINTEISLNEEFERAKLFAASGKNTEAIRILQEVLVNESEFIPARKLLATILYEQGNFDRANAILQEGLEQRPLYPPYVQLKAEILVDEGKTKQALNLLQKAPPSLEDYPDYHALIAALYQRLGNSQNAEGVYEQLLKLQPSNSLWWLGLGIARESQEKKSEALMAFAKANDNSSLSPDLKAYIESRMTSLQ